MAIQIKDLFSRLYKITFDVFFYTAIIVTVLGLLPDHIFTNFPLKPTAYQNEHLFRALGDLKWNNDLVSKAKFIGANKLYGPESLIDIGDYIYTGLADGRIVRVHKTTEAIEDVVQFGSPEYCVPGVISQMLKCGRALGLRQHSDYLYVLESSTGLYRINLSSTEHTLEQLPLKVKEGEPVIFNDLTFDPQQDGLVYISVSTSRWFLDRIAYSIVEHDETGYILAFDIKSGKSSIITQGHSLSNGIEITADQKYLIFAETNSYAIKKIALKDAQEAAKGGKLLQPQQVTLFGQPLPGEPDNVRLDESTGDILVGMFTTRPDSKLFRDYLSNWPFVRKALARTAYSLSLVLDYINVNLYPNHAIQQLSFDLYSGHIVYKLLPKRDGAILKLDGKTGQIKRILGSDQFNSVSEALVDKSGDLWFGSFRNQFLGRIPKGSH